MMTLTNEKSSSLRKQFFGNILLQRRMITQNQLKHVLRIQEKQGGHLGKILVDLGYVKERDIVVALVVQCHVPYIAIDQYEIDASIIQLISREVAHKYHVVPLDRVNRILSIVMADPLDIEAKTELQNITNCRLVPFIATQGEIDTAIRRWYDF